MAKGAHLPAGIHAPVQSPHEVSLLKLDHSRQRGCCHLALLGSLALEEAGCRSVRTLLPTAVEGLILDADVLTAAS